jgi:superfamily I DNA/RNA helicase
MQSAARRVKNLEKKTPGIDGINQKILDYVSLVNHGAENIMKSIQRDGKKAEKRFIKIFGSLPEVKTNDELVKEARELTAQYGTLKKYRAALDSDPEQKKTVEILRKKFNKYSMGV